jgi:hypothetical protein
VDGALIGVSDAASIEPGEESGCSLVRLADSLPAN